MTISVIIPAYNSEHYIEEALKSALNQEVDIKEIICVDDASTDNTVAIVRSKFPEVKIFKNEHNKGPSFCRNLGVEKSHGDLIAFIDSDDYWLPEKTRLQLEMLQSQPELEIAGGLTDYFLMPDSLDRIEKAMVNKPHFNCYVSAVLIRKSVFGKIGYFNTAMRLSEDQDWFLRAREAEINIKIMEHTVLMKRIHSQNITRDQTFKTIGMMDAIKMSLDRRRQLGTIKNLKPLKPE